MCYGNLGLWYLAGILGHNSYGGVERDPCSSRSHAHRIHGHVSIRLRDVFEGRREYSIRSYNQPTKGSCCGFRED
jgi:hypothetical protein